ncbi:hypothetical protein F0562_018474 [Nyssa sinensis]|uniref:Uncharacterized protein n=1 Tax=Nyssa sinensis TaxID=561372 RepID=A0A5J4ZC53_9ASTE|nr:hypothetical protein F0562_018474 [Nyssa sinensis]
MTEGRNAKIEDEIFETSISSPSDNLDKVDEALRVVTKEDEISLLAEFLTRAVRHGEGGEPLDSTTEIVKDDWNGKQSAFGDDEKKTELLKNTLSTGVGVEGGKVDVPKPVQLCPDECMFLTKNLSIDANNTGIDIEGVGIDVVDIEKIRVDVEKVGDDDVRVEMVGVDFKKFGGDYVDGEMAGVDFEKVGGEKVRGDYIGGEMVEVDVKN